MYALRLLIVLLLVVGLGACGGGEETDAGAWQAEVTAICEDNEARIMELTEDVRVEATDRRTAGAEVLERSTPILEEGLVELRDVQVPDDLSGDYEAFVDGIAEALPLFEELADALRAGERPDPGLNTEFARIAADTRPFATEHGLTACLADVA